MTSSTSGHLEAIHKDSQNPNSPCVILMHPHPLYKGNMHSKVLFTLEEQFIKLGFSTLRFNFRGVGHSEGEYDDGKGEIVDASSCCDWMIDKHPNSKLWVCGFSFGAYIAMQIMTRRLEVVNFIAVGLPVTMFDVSFINPCPVNGIFIHAELDEVAPMKNLETLLSKTTASEDKKIEKQIIKKSDHFFTNHLPELASTVNKYISNNID